MVGTEQATKNCGTILVRAADEDSSSGDESQPPSNGDNNGGDNNQQPPDNGNNQPPQDPPDDPPSPDDPARVPNSIPVIGGRRYSDPTVLATGVGAIAAGAYFRNSGGS